MNRFRDFHALFHLFSYGLTAIPLGALAATGELNPAYLALAALAFALSTLKGRLRLDRFLSPGMWTAATFFFIILAVADAFFISSSVILALAHFLVYLTINKLFNLKSDRDYYELYAISFFQLLVASVLTIHFSYALFFVAYQLVAVITLVLFHFKRESPPGAKLQTLFDGNLLALLVTATGACLIVTLSIFFAVPRLGMALFQMNMRSPILLSGFSDRVELSSFGEIIKDPTVAMRVKPFPTESGAEATLLSKTIRWRGAVYDSYDGRAWQRNSLLPRPVPRGRDGLFVLEPTPFGAGLLVQEIYLEELGTRVLFAADRPVALATDLPYISSDEGRSLFSPYYHGGKGKYRAISRLAVTPSSAPPGGGTPLPPEVAKTYLALPPLTERTVELAKMVTRGATNEYKKAVALDEYLRSNYRYSLELTRPSGSDPIDDFLFVNKSGNCVYFATSYALLLRASGVPSRLVTGFVRGEWNSYGKYFLVRQEDAHAWVEAFIPGLGWATFDPTPRPPYYARTEFPVITGLLLFLDSLKLKWSRFIVDYSAEDQVTIMRQMRRRSFQLRADFNRYLGSLADLALKVRDTVRRSRWVLLLIVAGIGAVALFLKRSPRRTPLTFRGSVGELSGELRFYRDFLTILARRGLAKNGAATPYEYARVLASLGLPEAEGVTFSYYSVRYGGAHLTPDDRQRLRQELSSIKARLKGGPATLR